MTIIETSQESPLLKKNKKRLFLIPIGVIGLIALIYLGGWLYYVMIPNLLTCNNTAAIIDTQFTPSVEKIYTSPTPTLKEMNTVTYKSDSEIPPVSQWYVYKENADLLTFRYRPDMTVEKDGNTFIIQGSGTNELFLMRLTLRHDIGDNSLNKYAAVSFCSDVSIDPALGEGLKDNCTEMINKSVKPFSIGKFNGIEFNYNPYENIMHGMVFKSKKLIAEIRLTGGETGSEVSDSQIETAKTILESLEIYPQE